jgi:hypothetical protein
MNLDTGALIQQTIEDCGAIVPDTRDEPETCDDNSPHAACPSSLEFTAR